MGRWITENSGWVQFRGSVVGGVRQQDYDVAVIVRAQVNIDPGLYVIQFGGDPSEVSKRETATWGLYRKTGQHGERFTVDDLADRVGVHALAKRSVHPEPRTDYDVLFWHMTNGVQGSSSPELAPFASEENGGPLAIGTVRVDAPGDEERDYLPEYWWLPEAAEQFGAEWIAAAFKYWRETNPDTFPLAHDWQKDPQWMTPSELEAANLLERHQEHAKRQIEQLVAEEKKLSADVEALRGLADEGARRLLMTNGEPLVDEVAATLTEFGFSVQNSDLLAENRAAKQEDLRISLDGWVCLAEVKGYEKRNASEGDLLQLQKAVEVYVLREGKRPDARWYIVNQSFASPPAERQRPLQGAVGLDVFVQSNGLVIDTRDLFKLRQAVGLGKLTKEQAIALLKTTGVLSFEAGSIAALASDSTSSVPGAADDSRRAEAP